jgi:hypothetical protein
VVQTPFLTRIQIIDSYSNNHHHPAQPSHVEGPGLPPRQIPHKLPNFDASAARRAPASRTSPSSAVTASCPAQGRRPYSLSLPRSIWRRPAASASTNSDDSEHRRRWRTSSSSRKRKRGAPPSRASSTPRTTTASSRSTRRHTDRVIDRLQLDHGGVLVALSPGGRNVDRARRRRLRVPPVPVSFDRWRNCYVVARHYYWTCGKVSYHDATDTWFHQDFHIGPGVLTLGGCGRPPKACRSRTSSGSTDRSAHADVPEPRPVQFGLQDRAFHVVSWSLVGSTDMDDRVGHGKLSTSMPVPSRVATRATVVGALPHQFNKEKKSVRAPPAGGPK